MKCDSMHAIIPDQSPRGNRPEMRLKSEVDPSLFDRVTPRRSRQHGAVFGRNPNTDLEQEGTESTEAYNTF